MSLESEIRSWMAAAYHDADWDPATLPVDALAELHPDINPVGHKWDTVRELFDVARANPALYEDIASSPSNNYNRETGFLVWVFADKQQESLHSTVIERLAEGIHDDQDETSNMNISSLKGLALAYVTSEGTYEETDKDEETLAEEAQYFVYVANLMGVTTMEQAPEIIISPYTMNDDLLD